ncbi:transglutaminase domain-containing protein [uncultured Eudoraea sp.]|uniref:transglutaminase domain-containing protein n=1 Tax=uncultured Eudoraea sp. TaxID=1035614 RepID=UPI00260962CF|nr:transglutaminase domain-containing protein [uncultured Eudoraea sp.]
MPKLLFSLIFLVSTFTFSNNYEMVDRKVRNYPSFKKVHDLGYRIQNDFISNEDRVRAAFVWLTHNMIYERTYDDIFRTGQKITYQSENGRQSQIRKVILSWVEKAFIARKGVCLEYSLILNELFQQFGLPSKVIVGIAKTDIQFIEGDTSYRNHTWNAVQLNGEWKLMDPSWASGYLDAKSNRFVRKHSDHYFFTKPEELIKDHYPSNVEWQLLDNPVDIAQFYSAPIYLSSFFGKGIELSPQTKGIISVSSEDPNYIYFNQLPKDHRMYYLVHGRNEFRKMGFKKGKDKSYISKIRLNKNLHKNRQLLTVFIDDTPILNFKIVEESSNSLN